MWCWWRWASGLRWRSSSRRRTWVMSRATSSTTAGPLLLLSSILLLLVQQSSANLNLYITKSEVRRILGLTAEMFYVREGVVNDYAMSWTVPVGANIHALHFTWRSTDKKPLLYNMAVSTNKGNDKEAHGKVDERSTNKRKPARNKDARSSRENSGGAVVLAPPYVNVSLTGTVPTEATTFTLYLPCTGAASAEVNVTLNINVTSPRPNLPPTVLYFKRKKICLQGQSSGAYSPHQDPMEERPSLVSTSLYYGLCGAAAFVLVLMCIVAAAYIRRSVRARRQRDHCTLTSNCGSDQKSRTGTSSSLLSPTSNNVYTPTNYTYTPTNHTYTPSSHTYTLPSSSTSNCYASLTQLPVSSLQTLPRPPTQTLPRPVASRPPTAAGGAVDAASPPSRDCTFTTDSRDSTLNKRELLVDPCMAQLQENFKHLQVDRRRVRLTSVLLEGCYGRLYRACIQADAPLPHTQVLVKTVQGSASQQQVRALCRDATRLASVQHRSILAVAAVSLGASAPPLLIFPDLGFHNLKLYLRARAAHLSPSDLQQVALQAAKALSYLHSCNILHTDLSARNCYISDDLQLRVSDTALSADLFPEDYQPIVSGTADAAAAVKPVAWMALEAILDGVSSQPCDVWSWGVLAWELSTLAQQPYLDLDMCHLPEFLRDGYRLAQPATCPDVLYQLMAFCWAINPQHRPRAALLVEYLLGLNQQPPSAFSTISSSIMADLQTSNHIPASSFLHNSTSVGTDLKRLNLGSPASLMNTSASVGGDIKGLTHQFHSHSLNAAASSAISKGELRGVSQLAPLYSKPSSVAVNVTTAADASATGVYSTPHAVEWTMPLHTPVVPPPLPPANCTLAPLRAPRPQHPLPTLSNTIIL
uniref:Fibroblast growth factor receptor-like n=1 Tax=Hirondellea gigas TaxID=1518452 RepID=A0A6A7FZC8_9CRUS